MPVTVSPEPSPEPGDVVPAPGEPGSAENPLKITDPRVMRALAHPARIAMLQHLVIDGPATATDCAEFAGLSPSACSYHLRALARYGLVEEDPASAADGRHRPWRARFTALQFSDHPDESVAIRAAGRLLQESVRARVEEVRIQYHDRESEYPPAWRAAASEHMDVLHVTPEELAEIRSRLQALVSGYRRLDKAERPPDSRRVHALFELTPWFPPDGSS
jgi:DNA-binding transcriptional ArsR family regulator